MKRLVLLLFALASLGAVSPRSAVIAGGRQSGGGGDYTTNMVLELIGDDAPSGSVSSWTATVGGNAVQATGSAQPTKIASVVNGHAVVRFDGSDYLTGSGVSITGTSLVAFAVVAVSSSTAAYGRVLSLGVSGVNDYDNNLYAAAILRRNVDQAIAGYRVAEKSAGAISYDTFAVIESVWDGTNHTILVNGTPASSVSSSGTFGVVDYSIGRETTVNPAFFVGDIAHIRVFNTDPGSTNRSTVRQYLGNRYGITVVP